MRIESIRLKGIGPFRDEVSVDLAPIAGTLVALLGKNGAGKSTLLESALAVLDRDTATRGSLMSLATGRDSYAEATIVNGQRWTIRQSLDRVSGRSESVVMGEDGQPALADGKVRTFDKWRSDHFPPTEVLCASMFTPQGASGFLGMKEGERKAVLLRTLGIERLEVLAERARKHANTCKSQLTTHGARIQDERGRSLSVDDAQAQLATAFREAVQADETSGKASASLESALEVAEGLRKAVAAEKERAKQESALRAEYDQQFAKVNDLVNRIENNRAVMASADQIRAAVTRDAELAADIARLTGTQEGLGRERESCASQERARLQRTEAARVRVVQAQKRNAKDRDWMRATEQARVHAAKVPGLEQSLQAAEKDAAEAQNVVDAARGVLLDVAGRRIAGLRNGLEEIGNCQDPNEDLGGIALDTIHSDDDIENSAREAPARIAQTEHELAAAKSRVASLQNELNNARRLAARSEDHDSAAAAVAESGREVHAAEKAFQAEQAAPSITSDNLTARMNDVAAQISNAQYERQRLATVVAKAPRLEQAEARIAELEPQRAEGSAKLLELRDRLTQVELDPTVPSPPDDETLAEHERTIATLRGAQQAAQQAARTAHGMVAVAEAKLEQSRESAAKLATLEAEQTSTESELSDWTMLADSLGRDGLQAMEIDAAGPNLTELVNDLLHTCHGPRFTVRVDTQRASADGKKQIEGCQVIVLDTEGGREAEGATFSGGERVIIGEALSLALSMLACQRAGLRGVTLVRDESGAALDPANGKVYVAMLRRAARLVEASHVLLVSHDPRVASLADATIEIADGHIRTAA